MVLLVASGANCSMGLPDAVVLAVAWLLPNGSHLHTNREGMITFTPDVSMGVAKIQLVLLNCASVNHHPSLSYELDGFFVPQVYGDCLDLNPDACLWCCIASIYLSSARSGDESRSSTAARICSTSTSSEVRVILILPVSLSFFLKKNCF